jgi:hypothetical protein
MERKKLVVKGGRIEEITGLWTAEELRDLLNGLRRKR